MSIETTKQMNDQSYSFINLSYLEMMADGDDSMKKVMLEMLLDELPGELEKMKQHCEQKNWTELGSVSHKMKSTLAFVGNDAMTNSNRDIEAICKDGTGFEKIPALLVDLTMPAPNALEELRKEFDRV